MRLSIFCKNNNNNKNNKENKKEKNKENNKENWDDAAAGMSSPSSFSVLAQLAGQQVCVSTSDNTE